MCTQNQPQAKKGLTKEDFIIPENWEPTSPNLKRLIELRNRALAILGPDVFRRILEETGITPEGDLAREDHNRR